MGFITYLYLLSSSLDKVKKYVQLTMLTPTNFFNSCKVGPWKLKWEILLPLKFHYVKKKKKLKKMAIGMTRIYL